MQIFVSRFSPERSLIGSFVGPGSRRNETPERTASATQTSAASSGTPQSADRVRLTRDLTSRVSPENSPARSASVTVSERSAPADASVSSDTVSFLTLLDQLRLRRNGANRIQDAPSNSPLDTVEDTADSPRPAPSAVGAESPLAERLRALTQELAANRNEAQAARPDPVVVESLVAENQTANAAAAEENLDNLLAALQEEGRAEPVAALVESESAVDTQAIAEAITQQAETVVSRNTQEQTLRDGIQSIATGLRSDAAIESRQNVAASTRNADAASQVRSRHEVQQNQRNIQSLQADRRSAQQEARSADQAVRQLQSRNNRAQAETSAPVNPGTSLDVIAQ